MSRMNDDQLDDLLQDVRADLSIEASPEFAAKVRQQIDRAPERRFWNVWTWTSVAATCGIAIVAGALWLRPGSNGQTIVTPTNVPAPVVETVRQSPSPTSPSSAPSLHMTVRATPKPVVTTAARTEPEVLIPPDQLMFVRQLMAESRERMRREGPPSRTLIDPDTGELMAAKPIDIPLIVVEPLPGTVDGRSGGRER